MDGPDPQMNEKPADGMTATARVPGTTSNLGPGFDCLGCALDLHYDVTIVRRAGTENLTGLHDNLFFAEAADWFFRAAGPEHPPFAFDCHINGDIPQSRGLGSSATVRVGILAGLNELCGAPLSRDQLFRLVTDIEAHPDNAAPTVYGGFCACKGKLPPLRFEIGLELRWVLLIPEIKIQTAAARKLLPEKISFFDAIESTGYATRIVGAIASGDYEMLRGAFGDRLHQPYRAQLLPQLNPTIEAAVDAGALGGFLSGSGSTIIGVTLENEHAVAAAMQEKFLEQSEEHHPGTDAKTMVVTTDNVGLITPYTSPVNLISSSSPSPQAAHA